MNSNLTKCKSCGGMRAVSAPTCPHCGDMHVTKTAGFTIIAWGIFALFMLGSLGVAFSGFLKK